MTGLSPDAPLDCARCRPSDRARASRSCCRRTTRPNGSGRRWTSCSATSTGAASTPATARRGGDCCRSRSRSSSSTTAAPTRPPTSSRRGRRRRVIGPDGTTLRLLRVAHGGKGAAVRAGMLDATADLIVFADADMATPPDQLPLLVAALADHDVSLGSRIQPDGSDMRATQPGYRRLLGKVFHAARVDLGRRPGAGHAMRVQGLHPRRGARPVRPPEGHEHRLRRRADLPRPAARLPDRDRADPLVRQARVADARAVRAWPLRVAWDLLRIPLIHRASGRGATSRT